MNDRLKQELASSSLAEIAGLLEKKETSSREITGIMLEGIRTSQNNAYVLVNEGDDGSGGAMKAADEADRRRGGGEALGPLDGVPMALKDDFCVKGMRMTCASRMLADFVPPYTGTVAAKLEDAGAILLGKLNMDEFSAGNSTTASLFGATKNPLDPKRTAGGSSGGSAAAVAEGTAYFAMGTDAGGSVRQPAAFCGLVGLKPTFGRVSRYGFAHYASSFDQAGPITRTVEDCAMVLGQIAGHDPNDPCSLPDAKPDYRRGLIGAEGLKNLRIGIPREYMRNFIREDIRQSVRELEEELQKAGALTEDCSLINARYALSAHFVISAAEFNSNMARYDGVKFGYRAKGYKDYEDMLLRTREEGFGDEVKRRILFGIYALSGGNYKDYYLRAQKTRTLVVDDYRQAFCKYDLLLSPTSPVTAWPLKTSFADPVQAYGMDLCTAPANLAGLPAVSIPWGTDKDGMPIGVQLTGPALSEDLVLRAAHGVEELRNGRRQKQKRQ